MKIEEFLDKLCKAKQLLLAMKANHGYSVVIVEQEEYKTFIMRQHYNGDSIEEAIDKVFAQKKEGKDGE